MTAGARLVKLTGVGDRDRGEEPARRRAGVLVEGEQACDQRRGRGGMWGFSWREGRACDQREGPGNVGGLVERRQSL